MENLYILDAAQDDQEKNVLQEFLGVVVSVEDWEEDQQEEKGMYLCTCILLFQLFIIFISHSLGYGRGMPRRTKSKDDDTRSESPSPLRIGDDLSIDGESSGLERSMPAPEEPPYFLEQW